MCKYLWGLESEQSLKTKKVFSTNSRVGEENVSFAAESDVALMLRQGRQTVISRKSPAVA